jgi:hypothetical protein
MDAQDTQNLITAVRTFCNTGVPTRRSLREFQQLAGWLNWGLNIAPRLRPGLATLYAKMRGKGDAHRKLWISRALIYELSWFTTHFAATSGISLFDSIAWTPADADLVLYTDASATALAFYSPIHQRGFILDTSPALIQNSIFFAEALALCAALHWAVHLQTPPPRLAIYTDSSNTVSMFNSFRADEPYNSLLRCAVDDLVDTNVDLRVFHVSGRNNVVADALSRRRISFLSESHPTLLMSSYALPPSLRRALPK